jgi:hypothetical protein
VHFGIGHHTVDWAMTHPCRSLVAFIVLAIAACGPSPSTDAGPTDAGPTDGGQTTDAGPVDDDAGTLPDGGTEIDAGPPVRSTCPIVTPAGCVPVDVDDVSTPSSQSGIEMPGATFALDDGDVMAVYPRYTSSQAFSSSSRTGSGPTLAMSTPAALALSVAADMTGATAADSRVVVLYGRAGAAGPLGLIRIAVNGDGTFGAPSPITLTGVDGVTPYWPQLAALPDGRLVLGLVEANADALRRGFVGFSDDDGHTFTMRAGPTLDAAVKGSLVHVGSTTAGTLVVSWQEADANWLFTSWVQLSSDDGVTYSAPIRVAPESNNVHDTFVVTRHDDGADLYYLRDGGEQAFNVFRRPLSDDGVLGPEQRVTAAALGHVEKPQARRLPDGRLLLAMARRLSPSDYRATYVILDGDAPLE